MNAQLSLSSMGFQQLSLIEIIEINGGTQTPYIDRNSAAYKLGQEVRKGVDSAFTVISAYLIFF